MKLLDGFCGAGGASVGYHRAGFHVTGVDIEPQRNYPFDFVQADFLEYAKEHGHEYDVIHASPVCKRYGVAGKMRGPAAIEAYPDQVAGIRETLRDLEALYVIENVPGAPLVDYVVLCGVSFGLKVYRYRLFESNVFLMAPPHQRHPETVPRLGRGASRSGYITVVGHFSDLAAARTAMG